jgi:p24 family protein delta-1
LVALVLPNEDELENDETLETWYVDQVFAMTKAKNEHKILPKILPDEPTDEVASKMSAYLKEKGSNSASLRIQITGTPASDPTNYQHQYNTKYFVPIVVNYVGRTTDARVKRRGPNTASEGGNLEGYGICLTNADTKRSVQVVFDIALISEEVVDEDIANANRFDKDKHLTPLEESLDQSINAANSVLREMQYMEKREARMRKTAEDINNRVRWFSYLSIAVLLSVTYIQVTYLKRYFHKKKLM